MLGRQLFFVLLIWIMLFETAFSAGKIYELTDELTIKEITDDVYLVTHSFPWSANSMLVRCRGKGVIWVDTPYTNDATQKVWLWINSKLNESHVIEINTGFHNDNLGGNGFLIENGTKVYGSDLTAKLLGDRSRITIQETLKWLDKPELKEYYDQYVNAEYLPPTEVFGLEAGMKIEFCGQEVQVYYPGPGHTEDNVVVYFPGNKLLYGGCMVKSLQAKDLGFGNDADLDKWPESLLNVLHLYSDARIIVPGHGEAGDLELIEHTLSLLR